TVAAAGDVDRSGRAREKHVAATTAAAGSVTLARIARGRRRQPRVAAFATLRIDGETGEHARLRREENRSAGAAAAGAIASDAVRIEAVGVERCGAGGLQRANDDRAAAVRARAVVAVRPDLGVRPVAGSVDAARRRRVAGFGRRVV